MTLVSFPVIQFESRALWMACARQGKAGPGLARQVLARQGGARQGLFELWNRS